ncbi:hypothetical protein LCGC14_0448740 [marine sediment metagenome]|uniref:Uncharacterized protein n=1 Tax=marine sediment metagenome TaxID=412755 RepID=A0A0F9VSD7_9ZZZZ
MSLKSNEAIPLARKLQDLASEIMQAASYLRAGSSVVTSPTEQLPRNAALQAGIHIRGIGKEATELEKLFVKEAND